MKKNVVAIVLFSVLFTVAQEHNYSIKNSAINGMYSDFGTMYYGESTVVFASARKDVSVQKKNWLKNGQPFWTSI